MSSGAGKRSPLASIFLHVGHEDVDRSAFNPFDNTDCIDLLGHVFWVSDASARGKTAAELKGPEDLVEMMHRLQIAFCIKLKSIEWIAYYTAMGKTAKHYWETLWMHKDVPELPTGPTGCHVQYLRLVCQILTPIADKAEIGKTKMYWVDPPAVQIDRQVYDRGLQKTLVGSTPQLSLMLRALYTKDEDIRTLKSWRFSARPSPGDSEYTMRFGVHPAIDVQLVKHCVARRAYSDGIFGKYQAQMAFEAVQKGWTSYDARNEREIFRAGCRGNYNFFMDASDQLKGDAEFVYELMGLPPINPDYNRIENRSKEVAAHIIYDLVVECHGPKQGPFTGSADFLLESVKRFPYRYGSMLHDNPVMQNADFCERLLSYIEAQTEAFQNKTGTSIDRAALRVAEGNPNAHKTKPIAVLDLYMHARRHPYFCADETLVRRFIKLETRALRSAPAAILKDIEYLKSVIRGDPAFAMGCLPYDHPLLDDWDFIESLAGIPQRVVYPTIAAAGRPRGLTAKGFDHPAIAICYASESAWAHNPDRWIRIVQRDPETYLRYLMDTPDTGRGINLPNLTGFTMRSVSDLACMQAVALDCTRQNHFDAFSFEQLCTHSAKVVVFMIEQAAKGRTKTPIPALIDDLPVELQEDWEVALTAIRACQDARCFVSSRLQCNKTFAQIADMLCAAHRPS